MFAGCNSSSSDANYTTVRTGYFLNYGDSTSNNGSISSLNLTDGTFTKYAFYAANSKNIEANVEDAVISYTQGAMYIVTSKPAQIITAAAISATSSTTKIAELQQVVTKVTTDGLSNPQCAVLNGNYLYVTNYGEKSSKDVKGNTIWPDSYVAVYNVSTMSPSLLSKVKVGTSAHGMVYLDNKLYIATKEGIAILSDDGQGACTYKKTYADEVLTNPVYDLAVLNSYNICAICSGSGIFTFSTEGDRTSKRIDVATGQQPCVTGENAVSASYIFFTKNDAASGEGTVYRVSVNGGDPESVYSGTFITGLSVNPDYGHLFIFDRVSESSVNIELYSTESLKLAKEFDGTAGAKKALFISYYAYSEKSAEK